MVFPALERHIRDNITYEVNIGVEPLHPDSTIVWRFVEVAMSDCPFGCKIYADPMSAVKVLAHNPLYGCRRNPNINHCCG
jgi:hypothetical protein